MRTEEKPYSHRVIDFFLAPPLAMEMGFNALLFSMHKGFRTLNPQGYLVRKFILCFMFLLSGLFSCLVVMAAALLSLASLPFMFAASALWGFRRGWK